MPVGELLARTSSRELAEWQAFEREYGPLGPERGDWQAASLAHVFATLLGGKAARRLKLKDFVLKWGGGGRQSPDEQLNLLRALAARMEQGNRGDDR